MIKYILAGLLAASTLWVGISLRDRYLNTDTLELAPMKVNASAPVEEAATEFAHWTCSNELTVLYFVIGNNNEFLLFTDTGSLLVKARFGKPEQLNNGTWMYYAESGKTGIAAAKVGDGRVILAIGNEEVNGGDPVPFECN